MLKCPVAHLEVRYAFYFALRLHIQRHKNVSEFIDFGYGWQTFADWLYCWALHHI